MQHDPPSRAQLLRAAGRQDGFGLIEVLVTSVVVIVVATRSDAGSVSECLYSYLC